MNKIKIREWGAAIFRVLVDGWGNGLLIYTPNDEVKY